MRWIVFCVALLIGHPAVAYALTPVFLERVIDHCLSGIAAKDFAGLSDGARFVGLTPHGARLAFDDSSGSVELHIDWDAKTFQSSCHFALHGSGAISKQMTEFFAELMSDRSFNRVEPFVASTQTYTKCEETLIEATFRRFETREQATFGFVSKVAGPNDCPGD